MDFTRMWSIGNQFKFVGLGLSSVAICSGRLRRQAGKCSGVVTFDGSHWSEVCWFCPTSGGMKATGDIQSDGSYELIPTERRDST